MAWNWQTVKRELSSPLTLQCDSWTVARGPQLPHSSKRSLSGPPVWGEQDCSPYTHMALGASALHKAL